MTTVGLVRHTILKHALVTGRLFTDAILASIVDDVGADFAGHLAETVLLTVNLRAFKEAKENSKTTEEAVLLVFSIFILDRKIQEKDAAGLCLPVATTDNVMSKKKEKTNCVN